MDVDADSVPQTSARRLVLDTNILLDIFVFNDAAAQPVRNLLEAGTVDWISTRPMRDELERVLGYSQIAPRVAFYQLTGAGVLARFDEHARIVQAAPRALVSCTDRDDQCFIDLAIQHEAWLISKDRAVLKMKKRLTTYGVIAGSSWQAVTR